MFNLSDRALRAAYDARHRRDDDYFDVAVTLTRAQFRPAPAQPSHWNTVDAPIHGGRQQTACGEYAPLVQFSADPTCPACRQQQAIHDSLDI